MSTTISPPAAPPAFATLDEAAHAILQRGLPWQTAAARLEACVMVFWLRESEPVLPTIRHILESEIAVLEVLRTMQTDTGNPSEVLKTGCRMLIHAAICQSELRNGRRVQSQ